MNVQENKAVMLAMVRAFSTGDLAGLESFVSEEYIDHQDNSHVGGQAMFGSVVEGVRGLYPKLEVEIEDLVAEGNRVVARLTWRGTTPSGLPFEAESMDIVRVEDGLASEHWGISRGWPA